MPKNTQQPDLWLLLDLYQCALELMLAASLELPRALADEAARLVDPLPAPRTLEPMQQQLPRAVHQVMG